MSTLVVVQAPERSTRRLGKVFAGVMGGHFIDHVLKRASQLGFPVVLALPELEPEWDMLTRFVRIADRHPEADRFVRIMGECPLWDAEVGRQVLTQWESGYMGTSLTMDGLDTEVFDRETLDEADQQETGPNRMYVTIWMQRSRLYGNRYSIPGIYHWSVDDQTGLEFVRAVMAACRWCRMGVPHHQNSAGSIGGPGRTPRWDLHQVDTSENRGGLVECAAYEIRKTRMTEGPDGNL